ncbi:MAG: hypothetical protein IPM83_14605 [Ignavibacteria bacterium]|nr:hypothetical protein [Ignavibacteria bacterium]
MRTVLYTIAVAIVLFSTPVHAQMYEKLRVDAFATFVKYDWSLVQANPCPGDHTIRLRTEPFDLQRIVDTEFPGTHYVGAAKIISVEFTPATYECGGCTFNGSAPVVNVGSMAVWATVHDNGSLDIMMCPDQALNGNDDPTEHGWTTTISGKDCPTSSEVTEPKGVWEGIFFGSHNPGSGSGRTGRGDYLGLMRTVQSSAANGGRDVWSLRLTPTASAFMAVNDGETTISISGKPSSPTVTNVTSQTESIYLRDVSAQDNHEATIDWAGAAENDRTAWFLVNGQRVDANLSGNIATHTFDVGRDLPVGTVTITGAADVAGTAARVDAQPLTRHVVLVPEWASPASEFTSNVQGRSILYRREFRWPDPKLEAYVSIPTIVPYVGGRWGLLPTGLEFNFEASSSGERRQGTIEGTGGIAIGKDHEYEITVRGTTEGWLTNTSLESEASTQLNFPVKLFRDERNLTSLLNDEIRPICDLPLIGEACALLNDLPGAGIISEIRCELSINARFRAEGQSFVWKDGSGTASITGEVRGLVDLFVASLFVRGGGTGTLTIDVPEWTAHASGRLEYEASGSVFGSWSFYGSGHFDIGTGRPRNDSDPHGVVAQLDDSSGMVASATSINAHPSVCEIAGKIVTAAENSTSTSITLTAIDGGSVRSVNIGNVKYVTSPSLIAMNDGTLFLTAIVSDQDRPTLESTPVALAAFMRALSIQTWRVNADLQVLDSGRHVIQGRAVTSAVARSTGSAPIIIASTTDGTTLTGSPMAPADIRVLSGNTLSDERLLVAGLGGLSAWDVAIGADGALMLAVNAEKDGDVRNGLDGDITLHRGTATDSPLPVVASIATTDDDRGVRLLRPLISTDEPGLCWMRNGEIWGVVNPQASAKKIIDGDTTIGVGFLQAVVVRGTSGNVIVWPSGNDLAAVHISDDDLTASRIQGLVWSDVDMRPSAVMMANGSLAIATMRIESASTKDLPTQSEIVVHTVDQETLTSVDEIRPHSTSEAIMIERGSTFVLPWSTGAIELYALNGAFVCLVQTEELAHNQQRASVPSHLSAGPYVVRCGSSALLIMVR